MAISKTLKRSLIIVLIVFLVFLLGFASFFVLFKSNFLGFFDASYVMKDSSEGKFIQKGDTGTNITVSNEATAPEYRVTTTTSTEFGLKIIKHGSVQMLVDKGTFFDSWTKIIALANSYSGNISSSNYYKQNDYYFGSITIVIPSDKFDEFNQVLSKYGKIESLNVSTTDVTGEYVDLNSKLKVLEEQRDLLLSWLKSAKNIDEMIKLRNEISQVEENIESIKGRLNYIVFHTDFSDVSISLSEKEGGFTTSSWSTVIYWLKKPLEALLYSFVGLLVFLCFAIPWGLLGFGIYKIVTRTKKQ